MAHTKQALKRWRQNEARRAANKPVRTGARTAVKTARAAAEAGGDDALAAVREAIAIVDRAAKHNVIHRNAASRQKSKLMKLANRGGAPAAAAAPKKKAAKAPAAKAKAPAKAKAAAKPKAEAKPRGKKSDA